MKKTFDLIKQIFIDNKEYFIKCTLMSIIAAFILGLVISFVVPASAADDPAESDQVVIPAGTYTFIDNIVIPEGFSFFIGDGSSSISIPSFVFSAEGDNIQVSVIGNFNLLYVGNGQISFMQNDLTVSQTTFEVIDLNTQDKTSSSIISIVSYDHGWGLSVAETSILTQTVVPFGVFNDTLGKTFTLNSDFSVDAEFASWFFSSTTSSGVTPAQYIIAQGSYYLATPTNLPFEIYDDGEFFFQSRGLTFSSLYNDTIAIIYGNNVTNTPRRVYTFVGENQGYNDFTLRSVTFLKDMEVSESTYNNFFASYKAVDESDEYQAGYEAGYNEGSSSGYDQGYQDGLNAAAGSSDTFFGSIIEGVVDALDKLVIIGEFSVLDIIKTVIGGFVVVFLLKLIAGG